MVNIAANIGFSRNVQCESMDEENINRQGRQIFERFDNPKSIFFTTISLHRKQLLLEILRSGTTVHTVQQSAYGSTGRPVAANSP